MLKEKFRKLELVRNHQPSSLEILWLSPSVFLIQFDKAPFTDKNPLRKIPREISSVGIRYPGEIDDSLARIFEDCGWPDESRYRKDECMERVSKLYSDFLESGQVHEV